ncbi:hypothetical protein BLSTO_02226 [Blastocystis sp. subtype 1]
MSKPAEVLVKWDKDKKWEEIKETKVQYVEPKGSIDHVAGVRYFMSENGGSKQPWYGELLAMCINFLFAGIAPFLMILCVIGWYSVRARIIFALSFLTLLIPVKVYDRDVLQWKMWDSLFDYFSYSIIFDHKLDTKQHYLYAEYPHGDAHWLHCVGIRLPALLSLRSLLHIPIIPLLSPSPHSLTTGSALMIPLYSAILKWIGCVTATNANLRKTLTQGSCAVVVDGIAGMYINEPKKEMVKFSGRKGFIRAAVETGTAIVPVYQFGNSRLLTLVPKCLEKTARKWQCAMGIIMGRFGLPIPFKNQLMSVCGAPVEVKKMARDEEGFDAYVDEVQQKVADEVQRVYYKYRCVYGWNDRPLEIY